MAERFAFLDIYSSCSFLNKAIKLVKGWKRVQIGKIDSRAYKTTIEIETSWLFLNKCTLVAFEIKLQD